MPNAGRDPPPLADAASSGPTKGPTQAKDERENVRPISNVPNTPPLCDALLSLVKMNDGIVISKAPSKLNPNIRKMAQISPFTHGLEPSWTTPKGPNSAVVTSPKPVKSTTIPRQNRPA